MQIGKGTFATTLPDKAGEVMPVSVLQKMVEDINSHWVTIGIEHDPRIPPHGRILSAQLVHRENGYYAVEGEFQVFENGEEVPYAQDKAEIAQREVAPGEILLYRDKAYTDPELKQLTNELATALGAHIHEEFKYSLDPISVLTVAVGFVGLSLLTGFFQKMGEDLSDTVRSKLKDIFTKKRTAKEQLLVFLYAIRYTDRTVSAEVILTNPTSEDIDAFVLNGQYELARTLPKHLEAEHAIRQITYQYVDKRLVLCFAVRADAVPLFPTHV